MLGPRCRALQALGEHSDGILTEGGYAPCEIRALCESVAVA